MFGHYGKFRSHHIETTNRQKLQKKKYVKCSINDTGKLWKSHKISVNNSKIFTQISSIYPRLRQISKSMVRQHFRTIFISFKYLASFKINFLIPSHLSLKKIETTQNIHLMQFAVLFIVNKFEKSILYRHREYSILNTNKTNIVTFKESHNQFPPHSITQTCLFQSLFTQFNNPIWHLKRIINATNATYAIVDLCIR